VWLSARSRRFRFTQLPGCLKGCCINRLIQLQTGHVKAAIRLPGIGGRALLNLIFIINYSAGLICPLDYFSNSTHNCFTKLLLHNDQQGHFIMLFSSAAPEKVIYFDNGATSFPKPQPVLDAVLAYMTAIGANPGRSGHQLSARAGEVVFAARRALASLFSVRNPMRVIFCMNATEALNLAISGLIEKGDHVITTSMEHNSAIRPLKELERSGIILLAIAPCSKTGLIDIAELEKHFTGSTRMLVLNHASNVTGTVQPLRDIGAWCREKNIVLIADCAQSAGIIPIDMQKDNIDLLAFSGHKGLYGPTGTGGLVMAEDFDYSRLRPLKFGGTGSSSGSILQPAIIPDKYESGTLNVAGLSGLYAGITHITALPDGIRGVHAGKKALVQYFLERARDIPGFIEYVPAESIETGVVSFNIEGIEPSTVAQMLAEEYNILARPGLHCSPLAHQTIGTFPRGTVRFSFGLFNTREEIDTAVEALKKIRAAERQS
jgi:cysteine desulfurase family protein